MEIQTHYFKNSVQAYEAAQTDESINDGDVLVIESEKVVGLVGDFPIALTAWAGEIHALVDEDTFEGLGFSIESINKGVSIAQHYGFPLVGELEDRDPTGAIEDITLTGWDAESKTIAAGECLDACLLAREAAERKAWDSLARYKFEMFGYGSSSWVKYNQLLPKYLRAGNVFKRAVELARESRNELARRDA